jgi:serine/threonine-protein kinase HipA
MIKFCQVCLLPSEEEVHPKCSMDLYGTPIPPEAAMDQAGIERMAIESTNQKLSMAGVQRKLSVGALREGNRTRLTVVGALGGTHILKPSAPEYPGMVELEHWSMRRAAMMAIEVPPCGLIRLASGEMAYVVKRFDREKDRRIPMEDLCQVAGQRVVDKYRSSAEKAGALVRRHARTPGEDALRFFDVVVFCLMDGNSDMHLKNWSLLGAPGSQILSPAYDLLPTRILVDDPEESALPINGKKNRIRRLDLLELAAHLKISNKVAMLSIDRIAQTFVGVLELVRSPWVAPEHAARLREHAEEMAARLR